MKKLKIAQIVPIILRTPPAGRGGTEKIAWDLTEELVRQGHQVTLFATGNSKTSAKLDFTFKKSLVEFSDWLKWPKGMSAQYTLAHLSYAFQKINKGKFDIVHAHFNDTAFHLAPFSNTPVIVTYHNPIEASLHNLFCRQYHYHCVSISKDQQKKLKGFTSIVPNGLNLKEISFSDKKDDYLITAGRIIPEKGIKESIMLAKKLNKKLIIVGHVYPNIKKSIDYYLKEIKPQIDNKQIIHLDEIPHQKILKLFSRASAFIFPLQWDEPFGLVLIEAMACGTPVVALRRGAIPEVIKHGYSGFIANNMKEMVAYTRQASSLIPKNCLNHVTTHFSIDVIAKKYISTYTKLIKK